MFREIPSSVVFSPPVYHAKFTFKTLHFKTLHLVSRENKYRIKLNIPRCSRKGLWVWHSFAPEYMGIAFNVSVLHVCVDTAKAGLKMCQNIILLQGCRSGSKAAGSPISLFNVIINHFYITPTLCQFVTKLKSCSLICTGSLQEMTQIYILNIP